MCSVARSYEGSIVYGNTKVVDREDEGDRAYVEARERRRHVCASGYCDGLSNVDEARIEVGAGEVGEGEWGRCYLLNNALSMLGSLKEKST